MAECLIPMPILPPIDQFSFNLGAIIGIGIGVGVLGFAFVLWLLFQNTD